MILKTTSKFIFKTFNQNGFGMPTNIYKCVFDHKKVRFASMPMDSDFDSLKKCDIPIEDIDFTTKHRFNWTIR